MENASALLPQITESLINDIGWKRMLSKTITDFDFRAHVSETLTAALWASVPTNVSSLFKLSEPCSHSHKYSIIAIPVCNDTTLVITASDVMRFYTMCILIDTHVMKPTELNISLPMIYQESYRPIPWYCINSLRPSDAYMRQ